MTAFEPPDFSFVGLQFNRDIFINPLTETAGGGVIPDPLPIGELDTNNIQALTLGTPVNLYTNFNDVINLGGSLVHGVAIKAISGLTAYISIQTKYLYFFSVDALRYVKTVFETGVDSITQEYHADSTQSNVKSAEIIVSSVGSAGDNEGLYSINAGILQTPNDIYSVGGGSTQYLYRYNTADIQIGDIASSIGLLSTSLTVPNTIISKTVASPQDIFTTTTNDIRIGGLSSGIRLLSNVRANNITATVPASSVISLFNNAVSGSTSTIDFGSNFLASLTTRAISLINHFTTYTLRSITNVNQRIQRTFPFSNSTQETFYVDNGNSSIITTEITVTKNSTTPTIDRTGTYQLNAGSFQTPNYFESVNNSGNQLLYTTNLNTIEIGNTSSVACKINPPILTDTVRPLNTSSASINLYTNFITGFASALQLGNEFLTTLIIKGQTVSHYIDDFYLRSNTNIFQYIQDIFVSSTSYRKSFFIDNGNAGVETCRIAVAQGSTPLVANTGTMILTGGTISLTSDITNLCNSGASSAIHCNAQLIPHYVYNASTGVANSGAIGYTTYGVASAPLALTSNVTALRSTVTIGVDGVYLVCTNQAITMTSAGPIIRIASFADVYNGSGTFLVAIGTGNVPSINGLINRTYHMPWTTTYIVQGATVALPFTFRFRLEPLMGGTLISSNNINFNFGFTRLA